MKKKTHSLWAVYQAVGKKSPGIKMVLTNHGQLPTIFFDVESARDYLRILLMQIDHEQSIGWRTKRNLDPTFEGGLDFVICPVDIVVDLKFFEKRGWEVSKKE